MNIYTRHIHTKSPVVPHINLVLFTPLNVCTKIIVVLANITSLNVQMSSVGPHDRTTRCLKSYKGRLKFELNPQHLTLIFLGPTLPSNIMNTSKETFYHESTNIIIPGSWGGQSRVKLNTTCETSLLPLYYMA